MIIPQIYTWRGVPIKDIERWAANREDKMVDIVFGHRHLDMKGNVYWTKEKVTMPETFWHGLNMIENVKTESVKYREPKNKKRK